EQRRYVDIARSSANALLQVLDAVLDFSSIESGKLDLDAREFDVRELAEGTLDALALPAHQKGLEVACRVHPDVPATLVGDPDRLRQVLGNLLGNAVKFTERGEVVLRAEVPPGELREGAACRVRFAVADTGPGIASDKLGHLFQGFRQLDGSLARRHSGTGVGLALAQRIVAAMGGQIEVESRVGIGSTFSVTVPLAVARPARRDGAATPDALGGLRALVIDDNQTSRFILRDVLMGAGARVAVAPSGDEGLRLLRSAAEAGAAHDLVLLDARMPGTDGYAVARAILDEKLGARVLMMLACDTVREDWDRCRELGIRTCLIKPVKPAELLRAVREVCGGEAREAPAAAPAAPEREPPAPAREADQDLGGINVLVADDNAINQMLLIALLEKKSARVMGVGDGAAALEALQSGGFDVVLMDVQMPGMDGLEATRRLRERERDGDRHVPVIGLTAHALRGDRERCLEAGMDAYVSKPVDPEEIAPLIRRHLRTVS
ncbi:MAG: response regulator, partial [Acidobacteria bacterium]|nr:response regulator [Acidobacteriota bacterium]